MDQNWPAQSSEFWPIEKITPYARNSRTHSDEQVAQIAASIREFGWGAPILVDGENNVIAGHGRLLAARKLGKPKGIILMCVTLVLLLTGGLQLPLADQLLPSGASAVQAGDFCC